MKTFISFCIFLFLLADGLTPLDAQPASYTRVFYDLHGSAQTYGQLKTPGGDFLLTGHKDDMPFAMLMNAGGDMLWGYTYNSNAGDFFCATITHDANFLLAGYYYNSQAGGNDIFLVKINGSGDTIWSKTLDLGYSELPVSVELTSDNGFILAGGSSYGEAPPFYRSFVVKLDSSGNLDWEYSFNSGDYNNSAFAAKETADGDFIVTGTVQGVTKYYNCMLMMKLNSSGSILWSKKTSDAPNTNSTGNDVLVLPDGLAWYFTAFYDEMCLMKTDFNGNIIWAKSYGKKAVAPYNRPAPMFNKTTDGGYVFVSGSTMWAPPGTIIKTDSAGELLWGVDLFILTSNVLQAADKGYMVSGNGPLMGVKQTLTDKPQIGIIKLDSLGHGMFCLIPTMIQAVPFTPSLVQATMNVVSSGTISAAHFPVSPVTLSYDTGCVAFTGGVAETRPSRRLTIIPNPSTGLFSLNMNGVPGLAFTQLDIYSPLGELVYNSSAPLHSDDTIDLSFLPGGIYYIRAWCNQIPFTGKVILIR